MLDRSRRRPRDRNQPGKFVVDAATEASEDDSMLPGDEGKNPAAVALGRLGGLKGGKARAASLSKKRRAEIACRAARARWKSSNDR